MKQFSVMQLDLSTVQCNAEMITTRRPIQPWPRAFYERRRKRA